MQLPLRAASLVEHASQDIPISAGSAKKWEGLMEVDAFSPMAVFNRSDLEQFFSEVKV